MAPTDWPRLKSVPPLGDTTLAGVYRVSTSLTEVLARASTRSGFLNVRLDPAACADKHRLLAELGRCLAMPDSCTRNWDALEDGLNDLSWLSASGYAIIADEDPSQPAVATALEILHAASRQWAAQHVPMWVFIVDTGNSSKTDQDS